MTTVETVLGPVDASELGITLAHEHLRFRDEATAIQWPDRYDADAEWGAATNAATQARDFGVRTIVDATAMGGGRDVEFMARVSRESGVHLIACTGVYTFSHLPDYWSNRSADQIAEHFVTDIRHGCQGTAIKAAFLKVAADEPGINENVEKLHRAVARAHLATGAPIMAHSSPAAGTGPKQVAILKEEGVDLSRVVIAHCGDTDDVGYIETLIEQGVFVGLDRFGLDEFLLTDQRNATFAALLRNGHAASLHLSQDLCATIDYFPEDALDDLRASGVIDDWRITFVLDTIIPHMREQGLVDDAVFETLLVDNPRRWLAGS